MLVDTGPGYRNDAARDGWNRMANGYAKELEAKGLAVDVVAPLLHVGQVGLVRLDLGRRRRVLGVAAGGQAALGALARADAGTTASEVTSPAPTSSASARATSAESSSISRAGRRRSSR